jgi:hypothetical protein
VRIPAPRRRVIGAVGAVLVAILAIAIVTVAPSSSRGAGSRSAPAGSTTVQRRDLVATDTESGTLSYANPQTVFNRLSGTITWLPQVGQVIRPGHTLYDVDNQPVMLMDGTTPAFRDLSAADSAGPDILELNRDLHGLGFDAGEAITLNDTWQSATTDAVERWQGSLSQPETGTIALGQVVFLRGARRITAIDGVLGGTGGGGSSAGTGASGDSSTSSGGSAQSASTPVSSQSEFVSLAKPTGSTGPTGAQGQTRGGASPSGSGASVAELKALTALLKAELKELRSPRSASGSGLSGSGSGRSSSGTSAGAVGGRSAGTSGGATGGRSAGGASAAGGTAGGAAAGGSAAAGSGGASAQAIMQTSSTQLVVTVELDASKQSEAVTGEPVTVEMPNSQVVDGRISAVSPVAQSSSSASSGSGAGGSSNSGGNGSSSSSGTGSGSTVPVTVVLSRHLATGGLDQAAVSVNFEQQVESNVLSVPVTALLATQGGGYAVQEAAAPHRLLPVTPGLFAAGYVQVSGAGIYSGLRVTDSQG